MFDDRGFVAKLSVWLCIVSREEVEQSGCDQPVKGKDSKEDDVKGARQLDGKDAMEKTAEEKAEGDAENGTSKKEEKDIGPR